MKGFRPLHFLYTMLKGAEKMSNILLSERLSKVAQCIPKNSRIADIGSDHAYLPIYLMQQQQITSAIAGEVVEGPFLSAVSSVKEYDLEDTIDVRLGDGLTVLQQQDAVDVITICGMGGELISSILEKGYQQGHMSGEELLVLQPNVAEYSVRRWLVRNGYEILREEILEDNKRVYEVVVASKAKEAVSYTEIQLKHGVWLTKIKPALCIQKWKELLKKQQFVLEQLVKSTQKQVEKEAAIHKEIAMLKELIGE